MRFLILGAGPAGLTAANVLLDKGVKDFLVLEQESVAGGLCRSAWVDDAPMDIGGGHFLDVRHPRANAFLFRFMPEEEWDLYSRKTLIHFDGLQIGQPFESHIWQMDLERQVAYLKSIAISGANLGEEKPSKFVDWIYWKLGKKIADDYMIPYNRKMFGENLDRLGTYWLEKLPNVSFDETLLSCLQKKRYGKDPGHSQFYYPKKYGYGELWLRMAEKIKGNILFGEKVESLNLISRTVGTKTGKSFSADCIINTIPWVSFKELYGMPMDMQTSLSELRYSSIQTKYCGKNLHTDAHWIYYPELTLSYHRILVRHNFCPNSRGYWMETNGERVEKENGDDIVFWNGFAYPLNTVGKPEIMQKLLAWTEKNSIYGLGRWGEWEHYNSDVTVGKSLDLVDRLL